MTYFINGEHQEKFETFLGEANVGEKEYTAQTVLYLLSSLPKVAENIDLFFVLKGKYINPDEAERMDLSTGERVIVGLAFNLYNGYVIEGVDLSPHTIMSWLDKDLKNVYIQALQIKMGLNQLSVA